MGGMIPASSDVSSIESLIPPSCDGFGAGGTGPYGEDLVSEAILFRQSCATLMVYLWTHTIRFPVEANSVFAQKVRRIIY